MDPEDIVALVVERAGSDKPTAVARWLGLNEIGADQRVRRWMRGRNGPDTDGIILMLERLGVLDWSRLEAVDGEAAPAASVSAEVSLAEVLEEVRACRALLERGSRGERAGERRRAGEERRVRDDRAAAAEQRAETRSERSGR